MGSFDVAVVGGGLAGLTAALAMARGGFRVVSLAPPAAEDRRTTALLQGSVEFLDRLGVWENIAPHAAPVAVQTIIDATGRLLRAPDVAFHASEIGLEAFGYNVANAELAAILRDACQDAGVTATATQALDASLSGGATVTGGDGARFDVRLLVAADGRNSAIRRFAGIGAREWSYPQTALALNFRHTLPHRDTCYEFHTTEGPFTIVPLGPDLSGLVWVQSPANAAERLNWRADALELEIERRMHSIFGKVTIASDIQSYPLSGMIAHEFGRDGLVLVGEAAHAFPPIAAQGFNLGLRDVETLESLARGLPPERLPGVGRRYHLRRAADVTVRTMGVDLFNRSLLTGFAPLHLLRAAGLGAVAAIGPLRRAMMREGVTPGGQWRAFADRLATQRR